MKKVILLLTALAWAGVQSGIAQADDPPPLGYPPVTLHALFVEEHRNQAFDIAIVYGRWLIRNHPIEMEGLPAYRGEANFRRMIDIYNHFAGQSTDPSVREAYLDSSLTLYNRVFELYEGRDDFDKYRWLFNRGRFFQTNAASISNGMQLAFDDYWAMFLLDPERTTTTANGYYVQISVQNFARRGQRDEALKMMEMAEPFANANLLQLFEDTRNDLFRDPEERIVWFLQRLEADPGNLALKTELFDLYTRTGNRQKANEMARRLYDANPTFENVDRMASIAQSDARYEEANRFLNEAIGKTDNVARKKEKHLQIADNHLAMRQFEQARASARRALQLNANHGPAFLKIADIYAATVRECAGREMTRQDKVVYWLVLDYLDRARQADASTTNQVQRLYATYEAVTPTPEEKFYQGWETGRKIKVDGNLRGCYAWINEETTIR